MTEVEKVGLGEEGVGILGAVDGFWLLLLLCCVVAVIGSPSLACLLLRLEAGGQDALPPNVLEVAQSAGKAGRGTGGSGSGRLLLLRLLVLGRYQAATRNEEGRRCSRVHCFRGYELAFAST